MEASIILVNRINTIEVVVIKEQLEMEKERMNARLKINYRNAAIINYQNAVEQVHEKEKEMNRLYN